VTKERTERTATMGDDIATDAKGEEIKYSLSPQIPTPPPKGDDDATDAEDKENSSTLSPQIPSPPLSPQPAPLPAQSVTTSSDLALALCNYYKITNEAKCIPADLAIVADRFFPDQLSFLRKNLMDRYGTEVDPAAFGIVDSTTLATSLSADTGRIISETKTATTATAAATTTTSANTRESDKTNEKLESMAKNATSILSDKWRTWANDTQPKKSMDKGERDITKQLFLLKQHANKCERERTSAVANYERARNENESLKIALEKSQKQNEQLQRTLKSLLAKNISLGSTSFLSTEGDAAAANNDGEYVTNDREAMRTELNFVQNELKEYQKLTIDYQKLQQAKVDLTAMTKTLNQKLTSVKTELSNVRLTSKNNDIQVNHLTAALDNSNSLNQSLKASLRDKTETLAAAEETRRYLEISFGEQRAEVEASSLSLIQQMTERVKMEREEFFSNIAIAQERDIIENAENNLLQNENKLLARELMECREREKIKNRELAHYQAEMRRASQKIVELAGEIGGDQAGGDIGFV